MVKCRAKTDFVTLHLTEGASTPVERIYCGREESGL